MSLKFENTIHLNTVNNSGGGGSASRFITDKLIVVEPITDYVTLNITDQLIIGE